jgi:hypothetical protein
MTSAILMVLALAAADQQAIAGTWSIELNVQGNVNTQTCTFKVDGAVLSGSCEGADQKQLAVTGEVTEKDVTWKYDVPWEGQMLTLEFAGALTSDAAMKGTIVVQPMNVPGDFTASKKPAQ